MNIPQVIQIRFKRHSNISNLEGASTGLQFIGSYETHVPVDNLVTLKTEIIVSELIVDIG